MKDEGYGAGSLLFSFLLGGIVGAGLALLVAPQSGRETRQKILDFTDEVKGKTDEYVSRTRQKMASMVDEGKEFYEERKSLIKSAIDAGKEAYEKEKDKLSKPQNA